MERKKKRSRSLNELQVNEMSFDDYLIMSIWRKSNKKNRNSRNFFTLFTSFCHFRTIIKKGTPSMQCTFFFYFANRLTANPPPGASLIFRTSPCLTIRLVMV